MNPFTERGRITDPTRFTGRWREVGMVYERLEQRRPVLLVGAAGTGKSSLLTHISQSAAVVLEIPGLASFYLDLAVLPGAASVYHLLTRQIGRVGESAAALEAALPAWRRTTLICLDNVDAAVAAGWGSELLEQLARLARRSMATYPGGLAPPGPDSYDLLVVAAGGAAAPALSEPYASVALGALPPPEVRLLSEAYLDDGAISFSAAELHELGRLSAGHPAYLQRAAYHLFEARRDPAYDWRAAYKAEVRDRPIIGAPLPPDTLEDPETEEGDFNGPELAAGEAGPGRRAAAPQLEGPGALLAALLPLLAALLAVQLGWGWPAAIALLLTGYLVAWWLRR